MVFKHFNLELVKNHENDKGQGQNHGTYTVSGITTPTLPAQDL